MDIEKEAQLGLSELVKSRYLRVRDEIADEEAHAGRPSGSVRLIGVTKFKRPEQIRPALDAGLSEIGENRAQELIDKSEFFDGYGVKKHFIGALQTNKVKYLIGKTELIQSVDKPSLAEEISRLAQKNGIVQRILLEVNIGHETQKSGVMPEALPELFEAVSRLPGLRVEGLMCIPPAGTEDESRRYFALMRELLESMKRFECANIAMNELSMGMSGDYRAAVAEGATMVRVGSAIFGPRDGMMRQ